MATITYDVTSGKPLIVGYVEETGVNTVILTGFTPEGTGTTVYISIEGIGLLDLTASTTVTGGYEFPIDYTITVMDGKFEAFLVEKNATNTYIRKSQPFEVRVKRNGRIATMAKEIQIMLHDWFSRIISNIESRVSVVEEEKEDKENKIQSIPIDSNDTETYPSTQAVVEYAEYIENKVTSLSAESTDTQYPSAKAVYNAIEGGGSATEKIANKKQTIIGNESSETYYPSTKAVADYWTNKDKFYWCTWGTTTFAEIQNVVFNTDKIPIVTYSYTEEDDEGNDLKIGVIYQYQGINSSYATFTRLSGRHSTAEVRVTTDNQWTEYLLGMDLEEAGRFTVDGWHAFDTAAAGTICAYDAKGWVTPMVTGSYGSFIASTTPFRPEKLFAPVNILSGASTFIYMYESNSCLDIKKTVNESKPSSSRYWDLYLVGRYDRNTGLFTLDTTGTAGETCYYKYVPNNDRSITLSDYFTAGKYYIKLGCFSVGDASATTDFFEFTLNNPMYYFDGTNLIDPHDNKFYWVTKGTTTYQQISDAVASGKTPIMIYPASSEDEEDYYANELLTYAKNGDNVHYFTGVSGRNGLTTAMLNSSNSWSVYVDGIEWSSNKKSTITGNESSTTYFPSTKAVADYAIPREQLWDAGITNVGYTQLLTFTATTVSGVKSYPYVKLDHTTGLDKTKRYKVTISSTDYILPCEMWGYVESSASKCYEYLGNISLRETENPSYGFYPVRSELSFLLTQDADDDSKWELFTTTAGTYTVTIYTQTKTVNPIANELIWGQNYNPIHLKDNGGSTFCGVSIGGTNKMSDARGGVAIGDWNMISADWGMTIGQANTASGKGAIAIGTSCTASGADAHAEGGGTTASGITSHAEGAATKATNSYAHAEGYNTTASGTSTHTEGTQTTASGYCAHAEGRVTNAAGSDSHAEGFSTSTYSSRSTGAHAEGVYTIARGYGQHVEGRSNIEDTTSTYAHIVGNGTLSEDENGEITNVTRSNAHTLDWSGNAEYAGDVIANGCGGSAPISMVALNAVSPKQINDQTVTYDAVGLGQKIAEYYPTATYSSPKVVIATIALYGSTAHVFGCYRPSGNCWLLALEGARMRCLYKDSSDNWSWGTWTLN